MKISVLSSQKKFEIEADLGERLVDVLQKNNIHIPTDCGGLGNCKKCRVRLLKGTVDGTTADANGFILSCKAYIKEPISLEVSTIPEQNIVQKEEAEDLKSQSHSFGIAFDLGTTTLAFSLLDIECKKRIAYFSVLNEQAKFGADVISRISASNEGHLSEIHQMIILQLQKAISYFKEKYQIQEIEKVVVAGNTTMLHFFLNISPKSIGFAPYTPVFTEHKSLKGSALHLDCHTIEILPSCSAFVGADITAGAYACTLPKHSLLIDLGTNGELLYRAEETYFATSTAAGPCLEGASMECGVGGIPGAISKVWETQGNLEFETIQNKKPCGICGAGFVDLIATLLKMGKIDETGALLTEENRIYIAKNVYISDADIRKFQLAKSAILAGIETLLFEIGASLENVENFYLAGGIGYYVHVENAIQVGLLPKNAKGKVKVIGNSSLLGAEACFYHNNALSKMNEIAKHCSLIDLSQSAYFSNAYIMHMIFE